MTPLQLTEPWILLCTIFVITSAALSNRLQIPRSLASTEPWWQNIQKTPTSVQAQQIPEPITEISCISSDPNIYKIIEETRDRCKGTDYIVTFYQQTDKIYTKLGSLTIDKYLFHNVLMKYSNWILAGDNIDGIGDRKANVNGDKRNNNQKDINNVFKPITSTFRTQEVDTKLPRLNRQKEDSYIDNELQETKSTCDSSNQGLVESNINTELINNGDPKSVYKENAHRYIEPRYNSKLKGYEVFLPKDDGLQVSTEMINENENVDNVGENINSLFSDEPTINKIESCPALVRNLDENTIEVDQIEEIKENINDQSDVGNLKTEVIDLLLNNNTGFCFESNKPIDYDVAKKTDNIKSDLINTCSTGDAEEYEKDVDSYLQDIEHSVVDTNIYDTTYDNNLVYDDELYQHDFSPHSTIDNNIFYSDSDFNIIASSDIIYNIDNTDDKNSNLPNTRKITISPVDTTYAKENFDKIESNEDLSTAAKYSEHTIPLLPLKSDPLINVEQATLNSQKLVLPVNQISESMAELGQAKPFPIYPLPIKPIIPIIYSSPLTLPGVTAQPLYLEPSESTPLTSSLSIPKGDTYSSQTATSPVTVNYPSSLPLGNLQLPIGNSKYDLTSLKNNINLNNYHIATSEIPPPTPTTPTNIPLSTFINPNIDTDDSPLPLLSGSLQPQALDTAEYNYSPQASIVSKLGINIGNQCVPIKTSEFKYLPLYASYIQDTSRLPVANLLSATNMSRKSIPAYVVPAIDIPITPSITNPITAPLQNVNRIQVPPLPIPIYEEKLTSIYTQPLSNPISGITPSFFKESVMNYPLSVNTAELISFNISHYNVPKSPIFTISVPSNSDKPLLSLQPLDINRTTLPVNTPEHPFSPIPIRSQLDVSTMPVVSYTNSPSVLPNQNIQGNYHFSSERPQSFDSQKYITLNAPMTFSTSTLENSSPFFTTSPMFPQISEISNLPVQASEALLTPEIPLTNILSPSSKQIVSSPKVSINQRQYYTVPTSSIPKNHHKSSFLNQWYIQPKPVDIIPVPSASSTSIVPTTSTVIQRPDKVPQSLSFISLPTRSAYSYPYIENGISPSPSSAYSRFWTNTNRLKPIPFVASTEPVSKEIFGPKTRTSIFPTSTNTYSLLYKSDGQTTPVSEFPPLLTSISKQIQPLLDTAPSITKIYRPLVPSLSLPEVKDDNILPLSTVPPMELSLNCLEVPPLPGTNPHRATPLLRIVSGQSTPPSDSLNIFQPYTSPLLNKETSQLMSPLANWKPAPMFPYSWPYINIFKHANPLMPKPFHASPVSPTILDINQSNSPTTPILTPLPRQSYSVLPYTSSLFTKNIFQPKPSSSLPVSPSKLHATSYLPESPSISDSNSYLSISPTQPYAASHTWISATPNASPLTNKINQPSSHLSNLLPTYSYQHDPLSSYDSPCQMKTSSASIVSPTAAYPLLKSPYAEFTSAINILDSSSSFTSPLENKGVSKLLSNTRSLLPLSVVQSEKPLATHTPHHNTPTSTILTPYYSSELPLPSQDSQSRSLLQVSDNPILSESVTLIKNLITPMVITPETTTVSLKPKSDWPTNIISNAYPKLHPSRNIMPSLYSDFQPQAKLNLPSLPIPAYSIAKPMKYIGLLHDTSFSHNISPTLFSPLKTIPKIPNLQYPCGIPSDSTKVTPQVKPFEPIPFIPNSLKLQFPSNPVQSLNNVLSPMSQPNVQASLSPHYDVVYSNVPTIDASITLPITSKLSSMLTSQSQPSINKLPYHTSFSYSTYHSNQNGNFQTSLPSISPSFNLVNAPINLTSQNLVSGIPAQTFASSNQVPSFIPSSSVPISIATSKSAISIPDTEYISTMPNNLRHTQISLNPISPLSIQPLITPCSSASTNSNILPFTPTSLQYNSTPSLSIVSPVWPMLSAQTSSLSLTSLPLSLEPPAPLQRHIDPSTSQYTQLISTPLLSISTSSQTKYNDHTLSSYPPQTAQFSLPSMTSSLISKPNPLYFSKLALKPSPFKLEPNAFLHQNPLLPIMSSQDLLPYSSVTPWSRTPITHLWHLRPKATIENLFSTPITEFTSPASSVKSLSSTDLPQSSSSQLSDTSYSTTSMSVKPIVSPLQPPEASEFLWTPSTSSISSLLSSGIQGVSEHTSKPLVSPLQTLETNKISLIPLMSNLKDIKPQIASPYSPTPIISPLQPPEISKDTVLPQSSPINTLLTALPYSPTPIISPLQPPEINKAIVLPPSLPINPLLTALPYSPTPIISPLQPPETNNAIVLPPSSPINPLLTALPYSPTPIISPLQPPEINKAIVLPPSLPINPLLTALPYSSTPIMSPLQPSEIGKVTVLPPSSPISTLLTSLPYSPTPIISPLQPSEIGKVTVLPPSSPLNTLLTTLPYSPTPIISPLQPSEISKVTDLPPNSPINTLLTTLPYSSTPIISPLQPSDIGKVTVFPPSSPISTLLTTLPYSSTPLISPLQPSEIGKVTVLPPSSPTNTLITVLPYSSTPIISPLQPPEISKAIVLPPSSPINPLLTALPYSSTPIISPLQPSEIGKVTVLPLSSPTNTLLTDLPYSSTPIISPLQPSEISKAIVLPPSSPINPLLTALPYSSTPIISPLQPSEISKVTVSPPSSPIKSLLTSLPYSSTPLISPLQPSEIGKVTVLPPSSPINTLLTALPYSSTPIISPLQPPEINKAIDLPPSSPINPLLTALPYSSTPIISPLQPSEISKVTVLPPSSPINTLLTVLPYSSTPITSPLQPAEIIKAIVLPPSSPIKTLLTALPYSSTPLISPLQPPEINKAINLPPSSPINPLLTALPYSLTPIISPLQPSEIDKVTILPPSSPLNTLLTALPYSPTPITSPLQPSEIGKVTVLPPSSPINTLLTALPYSSTPIISPLQPPEINKAIDLPPSSPINPLLTALPYSSTPIISPLQPSEIDKVTILPPSSPLNTLLTALPYSPTPIISPLQPSVIGKVTVLPPSSPISTLLTTLPHSSTPIISPLQPSEIGKVTVLPPRSPTNTLITVLPYSSTPIISALQPPEISKAIVLPPSSPINPLLTALPYLSTPIISPLQPPEIGKAIVLPPSSHINPLLTALPFSSTPIISPLQPSEISKVTVLPPSSPINTLLTALPYSSTPIISPLQPPEISKAIVSPPSSPINPLLTSGSQSTPAFLPIPIISQLQPTETNQSPLILAMSNFTPPLTLESPSSLLHTSPSVLENANIPLSSYTQKYVQSFSPPITKPSLQFAPNKHNAMPSKLTSYSEISTTPSLISAMPCKHTATIPTAKIKSLIYDTQYTEPKPYSSTKTTTTYQTSSSSSYLYNNPIYSSAMPSTKYTDTQSQSSKPFTTLHPSPVSSVLTQIPTPQLSSFSNYITSPYLSETSSFDYASQSSLASNLFLPTNAINYLPATLAASKLTDKQPISTQTAHYTPYSTSYSNLHPLTINNSKPSPRINTEVMSTIPSSSAIAPIESSSLVYIPKTSNDVLKNPPISSATIPNLSIVPINAQYSTHIVAVPLALVNTPIRYFTPTKTSITSENILPDYTPLSYNKYRSYQSPLWTSTYSNLPSNLVQPQSKPFYTSQNPSLSDTVLPSSRFSKYITAISFPSLNTGNIFSSPFIQIQNHNYPNKISPFLSGTITPLSTLSTLLSPPTLFNPVYPQTSALSAVDADVTKTSPTLTPITIAATERSPQFTTFTSNLKSKAPLNYIETLATPIHYTTSSSSKSYPTSAQYITPLYTSIAPKKVLKYLPTTESSFTTIRPTAPIDVTSSSFTSFYTPALHKLSSASTEHYTPFSSYKYFKIPQGISKPLSSSSRSWTTFPSSTYTSLSDKLIASPSASNIKPIYTTQNISPIKSIYPEFTPQYSPYIYENLPMPSSLSASKLGPIFTSPLQYPKLLISNLPSTNIKLNTPKIYSTSSAFYPSISNNNLQEASTETIQLNPFSVLPTLLNQSQLPARTPQQSSPSIAPLLYPSLYTVLYSNLTPIRPCSNPITPGVINTDTSNSSPMSPIPSNTPQTSSTLITRNPLYSTSPAYTSTIYPYSSETTPLSSQFTSTDSKSSVTISSSLYTPMLAKSYSSTSNSALSLQEITFASLATSTKFTDLQPTLSQFMPSVFSQHTSSASYHPIQVTSSSPISYTERTPLTTIPPNIFPTSSYVVVNPSITSNYFPTVAKSIQPLFKPLMSHLSTKTPTIPSSLLNPLNYNQVPNNRLKSQNILNIGKVSPTSSVSTTPNTYYEYLKPCKHFNLSIPVPISNKFTDVTMPISQYLPDSDLKTDLYNYITNDKDLTSKLYNTKGLSIPLGNFIITKKGCNNHRTESINSSIGLKVWPSNIKLVKARLELKCIDLPSTNFEPIINNISTYDLKEIENIVANYIRQKYGDVIVVNEKYSLNNEYEVIQNNNININNKYNLLWPVNTCSL